MPMHRHHFTSPSALARVYQAPLRSRVNAVTCGPEGQRLSGIIVDSCMIVRKYSHNTAKLGCTVCIPSAPTS